MLCIAGRGLYVVHRPGWGSMLGMTREGALCWAWPGRGLYVGHGPGVGSMLGMAREWALCWAWPRSGLYVWHDREWALY